MATPAAPVEHTTEFALSEKPKLVESLVPLAATPAPAAGD